MKHIPILMARRSASRRRQAGFSLIEAMVSIFILTISVLAMVSGLITSTGLQTSASEINDAGKAANEILESFRKMSYIVLKDGIPDGSYSLEDLNVVYDTKNVSHEIMDVETINRLRDLLTDNDLSEAIHVEHANEALRVTVQINRNGNARGNPVLSMAIFIAKNGINFR